MTPADEQLDVETEVRLPNKLNVTENKLFQAMETVGLKPLAQHPISQMTVDFAFPKEKLVIEINGPLHENEEQQLRDKKRWFVLQKEGWNRKTFDASRCYHKPMEVALIIRHLLQKYGDPSGDPAGVLTQREIQDEIIRYLWKRICRQNKAAP